IVQNKMIEIRQCDEFPIEDCQCPRLQGSPDGSPDRRPISGVRWRYQPKVTAFLLLLLLGLDSVLAAPQTTCINCDKEDTRARSPPHSDGYQEFIFDHQVSKHQAREALRKLNETHRPHNACSSLTCNSTIEHYCFGPQFINDHCWCELQHREEGLPYVHHICYADEKAHTPSIGSCFVFDEIKECCCAVAFYKK
ncbi:hypothetical protein KR018_004945, partial [Drosophila ironensis]